MYRSPTQTESWKELAKIAIQEKYSAEGEEFCFSFGDGITVDFSKQRINRLVFQKLINFAEEMDISTAIQDLFAGKKINETENRAVLHPALRDFSTKDFMVDGENITKNIRKARQQLHEFVEKFQRQEIKGYAGQPLTTIVNIGIGGSDVGPKMVYKALKRYRKKGIKAHFLSTVDPDEISSLLEEIDLEKTLFVIVSKSFGTVETMTNAKVIKEKLIELGGEKALQKQLIAVTANPEKASQFGVLSTHVFPFWEWVGGRFSVWCNVGISVALSIGYENYIDLLKGAESTDKHFKNVALTQNIPVINALISIWNTNFLTAQTQAIIPYQTRLKGFKQWLQQVMMESNGKSVDRNGKKVNYATSPIIWGEVGSDAQHSFFQLLHQGSNLTPADFIYVKQENKKLAEHSQQLKANYYGQIAALHKGRSEKDVPKNSESCKPCYRVFEGKNPLTNIEIETLTPYNLGALMAFYEHSCFVQGILWNIYSFDQWGVELGKEMAVLDSCSRLLFSTSLEQHEQREQHHNYK